jgi:hypothetical protein
MLMMTTYFILLKARATAGVSTLSGGCVSGMGMLVGVEEAVAEGVDVGLEVAVSVAEEVGEGEVIGEICVGWGVAAKPGAGWVRDGLVIWAEEDAEVAIKGSDGAE